MQNAVNEIINGKNRLIIEKIQEGRVCILDVEDYHGD